MAVYFGRYQFEGSHESIEALKNSEGVFAVVCVSGTQPQDLLLVQQTEDIHSNVRNHVESAVWKKRCGGKIGFCVNYTPNVQKPGRQMIVNEILNSYKFNDWK
jgi:hypothetical protein